jgi:aspartate racemase
MRLVGVLGGMGPAATLDFMAKVMAATPAAVDQDHVPLVVYQVPQIPSRTAAIAEGTDAPLPAMVAGVRALERAGAELIVIACNTAHHWHEALARSTGLEILHVADAVRTLLRERAALDRRIGLMATRATLHSRIFEQRLPEVRFVTPGEATQRLIDAAIAAVKAGDVAAARRSASAAAEGFRAEGAEILLLACTELPIALDGIGGPQWLDATEALARACVACSSNR